MEYNRLVRARYDEIIDQVAMKDRGEDPRAIIPTGLTAFDKRAGTKRGMLTLYGAATGEGKSIWAKHLMESAAQRGYRVLVFSMEDPKERTADRTLSTISEVNNARMMSLDLTGGELIKLALAVGEVDEWGHLIDFRPGLLREPEVMEALEGCQDDPPDLVLVDYLQALPGEGEGLERMIAGFCWKLNKWAQDTGSAVVAFSQVNNKPEERGLRMMEAARRRDPDADPYIEGFRPFGPSDLNWCSAAGHRAKEVGYLFRPGRYLRRFGVESRDDTMEISFPKANFGSEGLIKLRFDGRTAQLTDAHKETA